VAFFSFPLRQREVNGLGFGVLVFGSYMHLQAKFHEVVKYQLGSSFQVFTSGEEEGTPIIYKQQVVLVEGFSLELMPWPMSLPFCFSGFFSLGKYLYSISSFISFFSSVSIAASMVHRKKMGAILFPCCTPFEYLASHFSFPPFNLAVPIRCIFEFASISLGGAMSLMRILNISS